MVSALTAIVQRTTPTPTAVPAVLLLLPVAAVVVVAIRYLSMGG